MGCAGSKDGAAGSPQVNGNAALPAAPPSVVAPLPAAAAPRLNRPLHERAKHPSAIPASFFEREARFKEESKHGGHLAVVRRAVAERREGTCRLRTGGWGSWAEGWCVLQGHQLQFWQGCGAAPPPGTAPSRSLELVGAHLRLEKKQEVVVAPAGPGAAAGGSSSSSGAAPASLQFPDEGQRDRWMVALAGVPGLFRRVQDYYSLGAAWGHGATCVVQECVGRYSGRRLALKSRLQRSRGATQAMHNELRILQLCAKHPHPAIPRLHDYFFDEDGAIELVLDLMEGGELFDHIAMSEQLHEAEARDIFKQVAEGVAHLHSLGIAHRDLKPQNLMYASADAGAQVKIMDYDLARVNYSPSWEGGTPCGTLHYMAPEIIACQRYTLAVDMWSLGVILFILLSGHLPFDGKDREGVAAAIEAGQYQMEPQLWGTVSEGATDLVQALLQTDPEKRLTAEQVLRHPWLTAQLGHADALPLASPQVLRANLSQTERGRRLLALAALAHSEGDLRQPRGWMAAAAASKLLPALGEGAAAEGLDFDLQPVREATAASIERVLGSGGGVPMAAGAAATGAEDDPVVARLRAQLRLVATAAGLQDRQALEACGAAPTPASPAAAAPAGAPLPHADSFADLEAEEVEEQDLGNSSSAACSRKASMDLAPSLDALGAPRWSPALSRGSSQLQVAATQPARGRPPLALPPLRLPPQRGLPGDGQLLERLSAQPADGQQQQQQQQQRRQSVDAPGSRALLRARSARQAAGSGGSGGGASPVGGADDEPVGGIPRSTSSSFLKLKGVRLAEAEREPVDLAMQNKAERLRLLRRLSSAPAQRPRSP